MSMASATSAHSRRRPRSPLSLVRQEHPCGCGIAVLAMLTRQSYAEVAAELPIREKGLIEFDLDEYLALRGYAVQKLWWKRRSPWPVAPWTAESYVQTIGPQGGHFMVLLADGSCLDPAQGYRPSVPDSWSLESIHAVYYVGDRPNLSSEGKLRGLLCNEEQEF